MRKPSLPIPQSQRGFTLIEILITMVVLGVLMAVALPNLRDFIVGNRLSADVNSVIGAISYARSEAIVRNQQVIICPKNPASNACVSTQFWNENDMEIFVDVDGSDSWTTGDILLKTIPAIDVTGMQTRFIKLATGPIKFAAVGLSQTAHKLDIYAVGDADYQTKYGRTICISKPGRPRVIQYTTNACSSF